MADFDNAAVLKPVLGTADDQAMQGAVFTPWIDTLDFRSLCFLANVSALTAHSAAAWVLQESDDNGTTSNAVAADDVLFYKPKNLADQSRVFLCGYRGKKRYARAAFNDGAAATGQITAILGHPLSVPVNQDALEV